MSFDGEIVDHLTYALDAWDLQTAITPATSKVLLAAEEACERDR